jgi:hypothetical protein
VPVRPSIKRFLRQPNSSISLERVPARPQPRNPRPRAVGRSTDQIISNHNASRPALTLIPYVASRVLTAAGQVFLLPRIDRPRHHRGEARAGLRDMRPSRSREAQFRLLLLLRSALARTDVSEQYKLSDLEGLAMTSSEQ